MSPIGPTLIFGTTSLLAGLLIILLPETKNKTSPDTIQVRRHERNTYDQFIMILTGGRGIMQNVQQVLQSALKNSKYLIVLIRFVYFNKKKLNN